MSIFPSKNNNSVFVFVPKFSVVLHAACKSRMVYMNQDSNHCAKVKKEDFFCRFIYCSWESLLGFVAHNEIKSFFLGIKVAYELKF